MTACSAVRARESSARLSGAPGAQAAHQNTQSAQQRACFSSPAVPAHQRKEAWDGMVLAPPVAMNKTGSREVKRQSLCSPEVRQQPLQITRAAPMCWPTSLSWGSGRACGLRASDVQTASQIYLSNAYRCKVKSLEQTPSYICHPHTPPTPQRSASLPEPPRHTDTVAELEVQKGCFQEENVESREYT